MFQSEASEPVNGGGLHGKEEFMLQTESRVLVS